MIVAAIPVTGCRISVYCSHTVIWESRRNKYVVQDKEGYKGKDLIGRLLPTFIMLWRSVVVYIYGVSDHTILLGTGKNGLSYNYTTTWSYIEDI